MGNDYEDSISIFNWCNCLFAICVVTLYSYLAGSMDFYNLFICIYIYVYILFYFHLVGSANDCTVYGDMISNYNSSS